MNKTDQTLRSSRMGLLGCSRSHNAKFKRKPRVDCFSSRNRVAFRTEKIYIFFQCWLIVISIKLMCFKTEHLNWNFSWWFVYDRGWNFHRKTFIWLCSRSRWLCKMPHSKVQLFLIIAFTGSLAHWWCLSWAFLQFLFLKASENFRRSVSNSMIFCDFFFIFISFFCQIEKILNNLD